MCISSFLFTALVDAGLAKALQGTYDHLKTRDEKMASEWVNKHISHRDAPERRQSGGPIVDVRSKNFLLLPQPTEINEPQFATTACSTYVAVQDYSTCCT
jgi:hypothetical protein